jgi:hypothetical protein
MYGRSATLLDCPNPRAVMSNNNPQHNSLIADRFKSRSCFPNRKLFLDILAPKDFQLSNDVMHA